MSDILLHVFYNDSLDAPTIHEYIESVDRLNEIVAVQQTDKMLANISNAIYIDENRIHIPPDWLEQRPAIIFPSEIPFNKTFFLGIVFGVLGNEEKYPQYFTAFPAMLFIFDLIQSIINDTEADSAMENILRKTNFAHPFENYAFNHNVAVALNYGNFSNEINEDAIEAHYKDALQLAFEPSFKALTLKYYTTFLTDNNRSGEAMQLIDQQYFKHLDNYPKYTLEKAWCNAAMKQLTFPYDEDLMTELKERLWKTLEFFEKNHHKTIAAFLYMDAATIANFSNSFSEAISYVSKAVTYFKEEHQTEMLAQAQMLRGRLLYDWAQSGNPQFYSSALQAYQEALKVFTKEATPNIFADIHHQLGVIYAELPDENKKRSIWAALSATSFNEALNYYNKIDFPFEFGMVCNNFANAYTTYPQSLRTDNYEKALNYYDEALSVRDAKNYPTERAVTLLNYLEASWKVSNTNEDFNTERYNNMVAKANEIKTLTNDDQLIVETEKHLQKLEALEREIENS